MTAIFLTWGIAALAILGVIIRPLKFPEFIWAVLGALVLILIGTLSWKDALAAATKGTDVYLFLVGMMLLAEVARQESLFDYLACVAVRRAKGSASRLLNTLAGLLKGAVGQSPFWAAAGSGITVGVISNLINNLPMGLIAASSSQAARASQVTEALLVGVDHGPNLSVTGSLATILWLTALKREGVAVSGWRFLRLGVLMMRRRAGCNQHPACS